MQINSLSQIIPGPTDRAFICGTTGSGKTVLSEKLLSFFAYNTVLDTKGFINWKGYKLVTDFDKLQKLGDKPDENPRLTFRPFGKFTRDKGAIEAFFEWNYERGNSTLYIDEATQVCNAYYIPASFLDCLTRGREKRLRTFVSSQRPSRLAVEIYSEAENAYIFFTRRKEDRQKISEYFYIPEKRIENLVDSHKFIYSRNGKISDIDHILTLNK